MEHAHLLNLLPIGGSDDNGFELVPELTGARARVNDLAHSVRFNRRTVARVYF